MPAMLTACNCAISSSSWKVPTPVRRFPVLRVSPTGDRVVLAAGAGVEAWSGAGERVWTHRGADKSNYWYSAAFSPGGDRLAYTDIDGSAHVLRVFDARTGAVLATVPGVRDDTTLAFSPRGDVVVGGTTAGPVRVWDAEGRPAIQPIPTGTLWSMALSPDGTRVATGGEDQTARVWDLLTGKAWTAPLRHQSRVADIRFSADGRLVVTGSQEGGRVWDAATGRLLIGPLGGGRLDRRADPLPGGEPVAHRPGGDL